MLYKNQSIFSCDGQNELRHQYDGQIVLLHGGRQIWSNNVHDATSNVLTMQQEGHLVEWSSNSRELWYSQTEAAPGAYLNVQDDCNAVVYAPDGRVLWSTNTYGCFVHP
jgi:hypothetical protein